MNGKTTATALAVLLLTSASIQSALLPKKRKATPLPPMPPGMTITKATTARASVSAAVVPEAYQLVSAKAFGGAVNDMGRALAVDSQGNVILGGKADFRPLFIKRKPDGVVTWSLEPTGAGGGLVNGVAVDSNGDIVATGAFQGTLDFGGGPMTANASWDGFVVKFSSAGVFQWGTHFGGFVTNDFWAQDTGNAIAINTNDHCIWVTGAFEEKATFGTNTIRGTQGGNVILAKFSPGGEYLIAKSFSNPTNDFRGGCEARGLVLDRNGCPFVTGRFIGPVDFGGGFVTNKGGLDTDLFIAKFAPSAALIWFRQITHAVGYGATTDSEGNALLLANLRAGTSMGGPDLLFSGPMAVGVAKYSASSGTHIWSKAIGSQGLFAPPGGITVDAHDRVTVCGAVQTSINFGGGVLPVSSIQSGFVVQYDPDGVYRWAKIIGNNGMARAVATGPQGHLFVTGEFGQSSDFGGGLLNVEGGGLDVFLADYQSTDAADTADPNRTEMIIPPIEKGQITALVYALQKGSNVLRFDRGDTVPFNWQFLAEFGWVGTDQWVAVQIPVNWLSADGGSRFYVRATNTPTPQPPMTMAPASALVDSGKTFSPAGKNLRLFRASPATAKYPTFRLR